MDAKLPRRCALLLPFLLLITSLSAEEGFRTWTNNEGQQIEAQFISASATEVELKMSNGRTYRIALNTLSEEDQAYAAKQRETGRPTGFLEEGDLARVLLSPEAWSGETLPGTWREVSSTAGETIKNLKDPGTAFGEPVDSVQGHFLDDKLAQLTIIFLEEGNFVGYRGDGAVNPDSERSADELASVALRKEAFEKRFDELDKSLPPVLSQLAGDEGKSVSVGLGELRKRVQQYELGELVLNLDQQEGHLVSLTVQLAENFNRRMRITDGALGSRKTVARENVEVLEQGDRVIRNVPMIEQGSRGYCAMGTLSMVTRYYGLNLDIDGLAAAAGYSEGSPQGASVINIYREAADLGRLRYQQSETIDFRDVSRSIDRGQPILVWRYFSRPRDSFHTEFAKQFKADSTVSLPEVDDESAKQPALPTERDGGHASLITGYNEERDEVLFTESWLNDYRHRRMKFDELEQTMYVVFYFEP